MLLFFFFFSLLTTQAVQSQVTLDFLPFPQATYASILTSPLGITTLYDSSLVVINTTSYPPPSNSAWLDYTFFVSTPINNNITSIVILPTTIVWTAIDPLFGNGTTVTQYFPYLAAFSYYPVGTNTLPACFNSICDGFSMPISALVAFLPASAYTFNLSVQFNISQNNNNNITLLIVPFSIFIDTNWFINNYTYNYQTSTSSYSTTGENWSDLSTWQQVIVIVTLVSAGILILVTLYLCYSVDRQQQQQPSSTKQNRQTKIIN